MTCKYLLFLSSAKWRSVNRDWLVHFLPWLVPFMARRMTKSIIKRSRKGWRTPVMMLKNSVRSVSVFTHSDIASWKCQHSVVEKTHDVTLDYASQHRQRPYICFFDSVHWIHLAFVKMLPDIRARCQCYMWTLQQDGAPSHTARNTLTYLRRENVMFIEPDMWRPNSPACRLCLGSPLTDGVSPSTIHFHRAAQASNYHWVRQTVATFHWSPHWSVASSSRNSSLILLLSALVQFKS